MIDERDSRNRVINQLHGTAYCSDKLAIHPNTTGPGSDGISIPCPSNEEPLTNSVGFTDEEHFALTQVHGGFGHNKDGFWNYKFHNWNPHHTIHVQMWAICVRRG